MPLRSIASTLTSAALLATGLAASPALAKDRHPPMHGSWQGHGQVYGQPYGAQGYGPGPVYYPPMIGAPWPTTVMVQPVDGAPDYPGGSQNYQGYPQPDPRWAEMDARCRKVYGDKGLGGALLGGVIGGVVGNRVAGGNRVLGTVAGAAVGAVAGTAIDKSEDRDLRRECDDYARSVQQQSAYGYPGGGAYAPYGYMMVPVMVPNQQPCTETTVVTERWVDEPVRRRSIPHRKLKRIKEKRVYTG
jgi:Glycine zipper 2TM domain